MTFIFKTFRIRQNTGHHATHRIRHRHGCDLTTGEYKITQRDLLVHTFINEALVDAFIMAADQNNIFHFTQANGVFLTEGMTARRQVDGMHRCSCILADCLPAAIQRICGHHRAPAATVGIIIHLILLVCSIIPDLMSLDPNKTPFLRAAENALRQHVPHRFGEQGHNINSHRLASLQSGAPASHSDPDP